VVKPVEVSVRSGSKRHRIYCEKHDSDRKTNEKQGVNKEQNHKKAYGKQAWNRVVSD